MLIERSKNSHSTIRIAVSGTHGVGKTTFCRDLETALKSHENGSIRVDVISNVARSLNAEGVPINRGTEEDQYALFFEKHTSNLLLESTSDYLIYDRTILDSLGYAVINGNLNQSWIRLVKTFSSHIINNIDTYFFIPIEFALEDDGIRGREIEYQARLEKAIAENVRECRPEFSTITGSRTKRVQQALQIIRQAQQQPKSESLL